MRELGYRFARGQAPEYQELSDALRASSGGIDLGDLTDRLEEFEPEPDTGEDAVRLELVGPEGETFEKAFTPDQNLGSVAAAIGNEVKISLDEEAVLFETENREKSLPKDTKVRELTSPELHWDIVPIEEGQ